MATNQEILDAARTRLLKLLQAGVQEFGEGGEKARMLELDQVRRTISEYEAKVAADGGARFLPVTFVDE